MLVSGFIRPLHYNALVEVMGEANRELVRYDGLLRDIPNPGVLLSHLMSQEAVLSSKIEGTQATLGEVLEFEAGGNWALRASGSTFKKSQTTDQLCSRLPNR